MNRKTWYCLLALIGLVYIKIYASDEGGIFIFPAADSYSDQKNKAKDPMDREVGARSSGEIRRVSRRENIGGGTLSRVPSTDGKKTTSSGPLTPISTGGSMLSKWSN